MAIHVASGRAKPRREAARRRNRRSASSSLFIFAAFLGVMLVQFLWLRFTQVDTIPYSQFEQAA
jgi:cell division protease FtsH